jgi:hypothetical protein
VPYNRIIKGEAKRALQKIEHSFCGSSFLSHQAYALRPRREWASSDDIRLSVPVRKPALIGLDVPLTALIGITGRRRKKILICTQTRYNKSKA